MIKVNNAGAAAFVGTLDTTKEVLMNTVAVNINGPFFLVKAVVPVMPSGGRIINISSTASKQGFGGTSIYSATKAAIDSLTYCWAQEVCSPFKYHAWKIY
jgi:NAD(P)-dependent dehydrogenase (short-subunit alcohol dehydrogenase family)